MIRPIHPQAPQHVFSKGNGITLGALAATVLVSAVAALPLPADARERNSTVSRADGRSATRQVSRQDGVVDSSTTGANGQTTSRRVERNADGATSTVTGPDGQTATRNTSRSQLVAAGRPPLRLK